MTRKGTARYWAAERAAGKLLAGSVLCSWATLYMPDSHGNIFRIWTVQETGFTGEIALYDYPEFDLNWNDSRNPFRITQMKAIDALDATNPGKLHVARLSPELLYRIQDQNGIEGIVTKLLADNNGFILYNPRQWRWQPAGLLEEEKKSQTRKTALLALAATALTFID